MDKKRAAIASSATVKNASDAAATDVNKDSFAYGQERERFLKDLQRFHDGRGTSITRWPYIGGKHVDLYALFTAVIQRGGWEKVSNDELWPEIQEILDIPRICSNADYGLRQIYIRYLHYYEKINHFGQDPDRRDDIVDDDGPSGRRKLGVSIGSVAFTYNYQQHVMSDSTREVLGLSRDMNRPSDYASLERSLMSGLPNEVDFAMNVCLLLSNEGRHILKGAKGMRVVDCMLSHVGICRDGVASLKCLADDKTALKFLRFWNESINDRSVKELLCPESLLIEKGSAMSPVATAEPDDEFDDYWLSSLGRSLGMQDTEGQRVIQLIMILRNLSFEEENLDILSTDMLMFRFLMLCIHNRHGCIRQLALDTLSNIAIKMTLEPVDCRMTQLVIKTITRCLNSPDKLEITTALEALGRLCQVEVNEDALCSQLEDSVYEQMVSLLTLHDIQIVVAVLEALYQLSELGDVTTTHIAQVTAAVSILVSLLTLEVQAYGPESLAGAKVVEHVVVSAQMHAQQQQQLQQTPGGVINNMGPPLRPPAHLLNAAQRPPVPALSAAFSPTLRPVMMSPPPAAGANVSGSSVVSAPGATDGETFACNWLQLQYEFQRAADSRISRMDIYRRYVSVSSAHGLQSVITPSAFAACIRVAFPGIESETVNHDGTTEVVYRGIVPRSTAFLATGAAEQNKVALSAGPANPLIAGLQQNIVRTPARQQYILPAVSQQPPPVHCPSIQQALIGLPVPQQATDPQQPVVASYQQQQHQQQQPFVANAVTLQGTGVVRNLLTTRLSQPTVTGQPLQQQQLILNNTRLPGSDNTASTVPSIAVNSLPSGHHYVVNADTSAVNCPAGVVASSNVESIVAAAAEKLNHISASNCIDSSSAKFLPTTNGTAEKPTMRNHAAVGNTTAVNGNTADPASNELSMHLANGHTKHGDAAGLVNGICSPVPSSSSDDLDAIRELKQCAKIVGRESDETPVVVNGTAGHDGDNDDGSDLNDCDDVLCKAMIQADIIDGGGHPAAVTDDDDSQMSADFLTGFLTAAARGATADTHTLDSNSGYDMEAATAVADLLNDNEVGIGGEMEVGERRCKDVNVKNCVDKAETGLSSVYEAAMEQSTAREVVNKSEMFSAAGNKAIEMSQDTTSISAASHIAVGAQPHEARVSQPHAVVPVANRCHPPGAIPLGAATSSVPASLLATPAVGVQMPPVASGTMAAPSSTQAQQLQSSVVIVPPGGLRLPTGQFVSAGTRLLIRSTTAVPAQFTGGNSVAWNQPPAPVAARLQMPVVSVSNTPGLGTVVNIPDSLAVTSSGVPTQLTGTATQGQTHFVSTTMPQGQVMIQRAPSGSAPGSVVQRILLTQGQVVIQRPDGQVVMQSQQSSVRPVLLAQRPLMANQLRLTTGHNVQLVGPGGQPQSSLAVAGSCSQPQQQIIVQHGQLVGGPGQQAVVWTHSQSNQVLTTQLQGAVGQNDGNATQPNQNSESHQVESMMIHEGSSHNSLVAHNQVQLHLQSAGQMHLGQITQVQSGPVQPGGGQTSIRPMFTAGAQPPMQLLGNSVQLRPGGVMSTSAASASGGSVYLQQGNQQILIQQSSGSHPSGFVFFRQGAPTPASQSTTYPATGANKDVADTLAATNGNAAASATESRKRPLPATTTANNRSLRKKKKADDEVISNYGPYMCEWVGCHRGFDSFIHIYQHVTKEHFEDSSCAVQTCRWAGCDSLPRQRWSFMTHLQDRHLNEANLRHAAEQRRRVHDGMPAVPQPQPTPVYPPNAALQAIRRFSARPPFPELEDPVEGPLTKHIRLTSALILRNLARYSTLGRSLLKRHEQLLAYIALSSAESSLPISHCLQELHIH